MELTDFELLVSETALNIDARGDPLTVEIITDAIDKQRKSDKKTYRILTQRVYNALRALQIKAWKEWVTYTKTDEYRSDYSLKSWYYNEKIDEVWQNDYFKKIYDSGLFGKQQIEESVIEALVFEEFVENLKQKSVIFTIAGKGNNSYRVPSFHDFCEYKYYNMISTRQVLRHQIKDFTDDGLMLPHGVEVARLRDLSNTVFEALEYKKEDQQ